jgi:hypothetical protein
MAGFVNWLLRISLFRKYGSLIKVGQVNLMKD